jgi:hypothetical protein
MMGHSERSLAHAAAGDAVGPLRRVRGHRELQHQAGARGAGGGVGDGCACGGSRPRVWRRSKDSDQSSRGVRAVTH